MPIFSSRVREANIASIRWSIVSEALQYDCAFESATSIASTPPQVSPEAPVQGVEHLEAGSFEGVDVKPPVPQWHSPPSSTAATENPMDWHEIAHSSLVWEPDVLNKSPARMRCRSAEARPTRSAKTTAVIGEGTREPTTVRAHGPSVIKHSSTIFT
eukprot:2993236-Prymnesium_polylepis.1